MDQDLKEKIKLTAKEILMSLLDLEAMSMQIFGFPYQRKEASKYLREREIDKDHYYKKLWELEKRGYIKRFKNQKKLIELTKLGTKKAIRYLSEDYIMENPKNWDGKWRIAIFDIPEEKKSLREYIRKRFKQLGIYQLQKSVFVYPFDFIDIISSLKYVYGLGKYLQYIVAENIETEIDLVDYFYNKEILDKNHINIVNIKK
ncbi:hypothetical protein A3F08_00965 [Candidatus Berkelbacteria bacterium RIFCSPHIGHO2_12_FULL_36_9]|uniref:Transcriptional repressor PaaX-like central Cas2-like domain-containing protein n=1 Tax=Candidatus Berkelbacteria bacterium RIFCSPHIGHO2_12_FULL_36_9 TaxID=1797469 RepID=A0A1F5EIS8_9BACT|nr:MAG: hypothetical protein A3F08_00965 [Candidatus Berkelbacteria bacterium RIFCSPHIGHO2_12_FULL_36_9]